MGADAELLHPTMSREEAYARPCHTRAEGECGCFIDDGRTAWACEGHRAPAAGPTPTATESDKVMECGCRFGAVGPAKEACERHREPVASAVAEGWGSLGDGAHRWVSPCGRATADVWFSMHDNGWRYKVNVAGAPADAAGLWVLDAARGRELAARVARERLAELDAERTAAIKRGMAWGRGASPVPAPADEWRYNGCGAYVWASPCQRVHAMVWANTHDKDWRWTVDSPAQAVQAVGNPALSREAAQEMALDTARRRIAELDAAPPSSKWHSIAVDIAATVAEKNAAYGDSVTRSADIMRVLYPDGIPVGAYGDALLIVRVLDKLSRIATDRDALGESPWRDIAGYALRACEGAK